MEFGNVTSYRELSEEMKRVTPPPVLKQIAAMSLAFSLDQVGGVDKLLKFPIDIVQYVLPHLKNQHLGEILDRVQGGLSALLIPQQQADGRPSQLCLPSLACRQALLKSMSERINLLLVERPNFLLPNGSIVLGSIAKGSLRQPLLGLMPEVKQLKREWSNLQQTAINFCTSFLDGNTDLYNFRQFLDFFGDNGLTHILGISVSRMLSHFLLSEEFYINEIKLAEMNEDSSRWCVRLILWLTKTSVGFRNRRIVTSTVASFVYNMVKQQAGSPLLGCYPPKLTLGLKRALKLAGLVPFTCYVKPQQEQFNLGRICTFEFLDDNNENHERAKWLVAMDATAFQQGPPKCKKNFDLTRSKAKICVNRLMSAFHQPELVEAFVFLQLAQAHTAYLHDRYYDSLTLVLSLLCDMESVKATVNKADSLKTVLKEEDLTESDKLKQKFFHQKAVREVLPKIYLLLTQTLVKMHANPKTVFLVFRQARACANSLLPPPEHVDGGYGTATHLLDGEFALTMLQVLNEQGLLSHAADFFHLVVMENKLFLKQSTIYFQFCVEYVQESAFSFVENVFGFCVAHQHFHSECEHPKYLVDPENLLDHQLLQISQVLGEVKDLLQTLQRWVKSGKAVYQHTSHHYYLSSWGHDYQESTIDFLLLKCNLYEWLAMFASRHSLKANTVAAAADEGDFLRRNKNHLLTSFSDMLDRFNRMAESVAADHPLWLELARLNDLVVNLWDVVNAHYTINDAQRLRYSTYGKETLLANLNMVEAQTGTSHSLHRAAAAFQGFILASVIVSFAGNNGRGKMYDSEILKDAKNSYTNATRNTHYRLHLINFLFALNFCQKKKSPSSTNPSTDVFPPWRTQSQHKFFYNPRDEFVNPLAKNKIKDGGEDRINHLTNVQATIEQGFRLMGVISGSPTAAVATISAALSSQQEEDAYVRAMMGLVKCGVIPKWELFCNNRDKTAAAAATTTTYKQHPDFEFVVCTLFKNLLDCEMIGAAINLATSGSVSAWRFTTTLASADSDDSDSDSDSENKENQPPAAKKYRH